MKSLRIRNVPVTLKEEIRRRAAEHGRSMSAEVITIIEEEARRRKVEAKLERQLRQFRSKLDTDT